MSGAWSHVLPAFALGFALGAAPGPVQVLILSETARRGFGGGLRVMLGANGALFVVLIALAFGFSVLTPSEDVLRVLRIAGGAFLVWLSAAELRSLRGEARGVERPIRRGGLGPTALGVASVIVNPGAWIFFGTTAASVVAAAALDGGRRAALVAGVAMTIGVSLSDLTFTLVGSGGRRVIGDAKLLRIRVGLAVVLGAIGVGFALRGLGVL